jgi:hypothetical protein
MQVNLIYNSKLKKLVNGRERETPIGDLSIKKGGTFIISFRVDGNYSQWIPKAQIRNNYLEANGLVIATFEFLPLVYSTQDNKTLITLRLKGGVTTNLPVTNFQALSTQTPSVNNCLVYDLELIDPNDTNNIMKVIEASFVQVSPEVTNGN